LIVPLYGSLMKTGDAFVSRMFTVRANRHFAPFVSVTVNAKMGRVMFVS
jgi:hypothetical protein